MATHVVTGAFSYTGKYLARRLLAAGHKVRTLTGHPRPDDARSKQVDVFPLAFDYPLTLAQAMEGADTLFNTYWIRFERDEATFARAIVNSRALVQAAVDAGVRRIVHISITGANPRSRLPYFQGKGMVEDIIASSGLSYAVLRPAVIFGDEDILVNNIAWSLRRFPIVPIAGKGAYSLQPIFVDDLASIMADAAVGDENSTRDAVGPERYTYAALVRLVGVAIGRRRRRLRLPTPLVRLMTAGLGLAVGDTVLTGDEFAGLQANLLVSDDPPLGWTSLRAWVSEHAESVGRRYASETARHYR